MQIASGLLHAELNPRLELVDQACGLFQTFVHVPAKKVLRSGSNPRFFGELPTYVGHRLRAGLILGIEAFLDRTKSSLKSLSQIT